MAYTPRGNREDGPIVGEEFEYEDNLVTVKKSDLLNIERMADDQIITVGAIKELINQAIVQLESISIEGINSQTDVIQAIGKLRGALIKLG